MRKIAALLIFISSACGAQQIASTNATGPAGSVIGYNAAGHNWLYVPVDTNGYLLVDCPDCTGSTLPTATAAGQAPVSTGAGTDYTAQAIVLESPSSSQLISQPSGTSLNVTSLNQSLNAFAFPNGCTTTSGGVTTSQGDCAFFSAVDLATTTSNSVDLNIGDGYLLACQQWVQPTNGFYGVNIIGTNMNSSFIAKNCSHPTQAMMVKTAGSAFFNMRNVTWQTDGNAGSCYDLTGGMIGGAIDNVNCIATETSATSTLDHAVQLGSSGSFAEDFVIHNLLISQGVFGSPGSLASLTATGSTSITGITINSGGGGYTSPWALGIVNDPHGYCHANEPTFTVTLASGVVSGTSITNAGTCSGGLPDLVVGELLNVTYGAKMYLSDSIIDYFEPTQTGLTGGIFFGGNTTINHAHPTQVPIGIAVDSPVAVINSEIDTPLSVGIQFQAAGSAVSGTGVFNSLSNVPGVSIYQFTGSGAAQFGQEASLCGGASPTDYQRFTNATGVLVPGGSGWPSSATTYGSDLTCTAIPATQAIDYSPNFTTVHLKGAGGFADFTGFWTFLNGFTTASGQPYYANGFIEMDTLGTASGGTNYGSNLIDFNGQYSTGISDDFHLSSVVAAGAGNVETDVSLTHNNGSTGAHYFDVSSLTGIKASALLISGSRKGTFTCTAAGTITISNTNETNGSDVIISLDSQGGTISTAPVMKTVTSGTGFTVLCGAADTSIYNYDILN